MQRLAGLQESNHRRPLPRRGIGTSTLWKIIYCMQCVTTCVVPYCHESYSYVPSSIKHTANIEIRECVKWSLTGGENNGKSLTRQAQKVVVVAYGRRSFTRGSSCKALIEKVLVVWIGGRLWEVVAYERCSHIEPRLYLDSHSDFISAPHHLCVKSLIQDLIIPLFSTEQKHL